jgi:hypothetical protein
MMCRKLGGWRNPWFIRGRRRGEALNNSEEDGHDGFEMYTREGRLMCSDLGI